MAEVLISSLDMIQNNYVCAELPCSFSRRTSLWTRPRFQRPTWSIWATFSSVRTSSTSLRSPTSKLYVAALYGSRFRWSTLSRARWPRSRLLPATDPTRSSSSTTPLYSVWISLYGLDLHWVPLHCAEVVHGAADHPSSQYESFCVVFDGDRHPGSWDLERVWEEADGIQAGQQLDGEQPQLPSRWSCWSLFHPSSPFCSLSLYEYFWSSSSSSFSLYEYYGGWLSRQQLVFRMSMCSLFCIVFLSYC